jgi:tetratricopeptide (TPR) repeat protein
MPEALKDYLLAASMNQNDDVVLEKIGRIYGKEMHNIDSALIYFTRAYEKNTQNLDAISGLAIVYGIKGDLGKSLQFSLAGLKIKGDDPPLLYNIGITYKNLGEKEKGEEFLQRAFRLDPSLKH